MRQSHFYSWVRAKGLRVHVNDISCEKHLPGSVLIAVFFFSSWVLKNLASSFLCHLLILKEEHGSSPGEFLEVIVY